jgi:hypothetical protein
VSTIATAPDAARRPAGSTTTISTSRSVAVGHGHRVPLANGGIAHLGPGERHRPGRVAQLEPEAPGGAVRRRRGPRDEEVPAAAPVAWSTTGGCGASALSVTTRATADGRERVADPVALARAITR